MGVYDDDVVISSTNQVDLAQVLPRVIFITNEDINVVYAFHIMVRSLVSDVSYSY